MSKQGIACARACMREQLLICLGGYARSITCHLHIRIGDYVRTCIA